MHTIVAIALTAVNSLLICLSQIALWQRKEYRIDRMQDFLRSSEKSVYKQGFVVASGILLGLAWILASELLAVFSMLGIFLGHGIRTYKRGVFRPDFTLRASLVFLCTVFLSIVWLATSSSTSIHLATYTFFLPVVVALAVGVVSLPARIKKQRTISQAQVFRDSLKNLTVVGITGSVGKTSTKAYLTHLLGGESESIVATNKHRNSAYSVAQDMLLRLTKKSTIYIAEMGAYIPGEIAELAHLTKPSIGIVTAITNQHVGLFGSLEALSKTKWELIHALPDNGLAILNKDDAQTLLQAKDTKKKIIWFSTSNTADVYMREVVLHQNKTECVISIIGEDHHVVLPTISKGQLTPILAAICGAIALQIDIATIVKRLATLPPLSRTMELRLGISGATVIDDSYSASEASVTNAISYLEASSTKDIRLVLVPIIELGAQSAAVHERIGALLSNVNARVLIYGEDNKEYIKKGLGSDPKADVVWINDAKELTEKALLGITNKSVVLLEGRVPSILRFSVMPAGDAE
ncbi:MAG: UDP-N-acetylmuramoyl-tripeptide--D-alanyl-D-alanine ligase [bacterium]|nr:UDP-N-acetylmuramoyl-tripeptide--D-alanyl-D-alanine ligase [bacterium]